MSESRQFTSDWFLPVIPLWEKILKPYADQPDVHMMEIGSWEGRSACWLLDNILTHPSSSLTCVDTFNGEPYHPMDKGHAIAVEARFDANIADTNKNHRVHKIKGPSEQMLRTLPFNRFDCIYIDGAHRSACVLRDAILSWDLLKSGGMMIFDDYGWERHPADSLEHPKRGIDAFLDVYNEELDVIHRKYQVVVRKKAAH